MSKVDQVVGSLVPIARDYWYLYRGFPYYVYLGNSLSSIIASSVSITVVSLAQYKSGIKGHIILSIYHKIGLNYSKISL